MRTRPLVIGCLAIGGAIISYLYVCRTPSPPSALMQLAGYETRTDSMIATVVITNTGKYALSYWDSAGVAPCMVHARVAGFETNFSSGGGFPLSMSGENVVWPSRSVRIRVTLPLETESWRVSLPIKGASARIKVAHRMMESGVWNKTFPASEWSLRLFPRKSSAEKELASATFQVVTNAPP